MRAIRDLLDRLLSGACAFRRFHRVAGDIAGRGGFLLQLPFQRKECGFPFFNPATGVVLADGVCVADQQDLTLGVSYKGAHSKRHRTGESEILAEKEHSQFTDQIRISHGFERRFMRPSAA